MTWKVKYPVTIVSVFIWIGFVCAISFMEAWLKFRAPGITLPLGLGIGRLVFHALNKVELVLVIISLLSMFFSGIRRFHKWHIFFLVPFIILAIQSIWMLPALDYRAELHIQGKSVPSSNLHFYYVGLEILKVVCLSIFGAKLFKL